MSFSLFSDIVVLQCDHNGIQYNIRYLYILASNCAFSLLRTFFSLLFLLTPQQHVVIWSVLIHLSAHNENMPLFRIHTFICYGFIASAIFEKQVLKKCQLLFDFAAERNFASLLPIWIFILFCQAESKAKYRPKT